MSYVVITGASSGIGKACAIRFAKAGYHLYLIARRKEALEACQLEIKSINNQVQSSILVSDLSTEQGIDQVISKLKSISIKFLIHNAASIQPISSLLSISRQDWHEHMMLNLYAPLYLTQGLYSQMSHGRIMHISSGAAHKSIGGWGAYCISKSALYRMWDCLIDELKAHHISIASVRPGVVDTEMQAQIRATNDQSFIQKEYFQELYEQDQLLDSAYVADYLFKLCTQTSTQVFSEKEWDIRLHPLDS